MVYLVSWWESPSLIKAHSHYISAFSPAGHCNSTEIEHFLSMWKSSGLWQVWTTLELSLEPTLKMIEDGESFCLLKLDICRLQSPPNFKLIHTTLQICCNLRQTVAAFQQRDGNAFFYLCSIAVNCLGCSDRRLVWTNDPLGRLLWFLRDSFLDEGREYRWCRWLLLLLLWRRLDEMVVRAAILRHHRHVALFTRRSHALQIWRVSTSRAAWTDDKIKSCSILPQK